MDRSIQSKALIFGASGQDGFYLARHCRERNILPIGVSRSSGGDWLRGDVSHRASVEALVKEHRPEYIFHLAANSTTRHTALFENHETILTGALNVLEAVRTLAPDARVFLCGSGLQFLNKGEPISENASFDPTSAYSAARIQSVYAARYFRTLGLRVYIGYLFHHESPWRKALHVSRKVALAAKRIASGSGERLEIGDVRVRKEWGFAGDIVHGMLGLVEQAEVFEAVIGTGAAYSIENWLERCFQSVKLDWRRHTTVAADFVAEYPCLVSDPSTMHSLGWRPTVSFEQLVAMMMTEEPRGPMIK